jgi:hypothetical protein
MFEVLSPQEHKVTSAMLAAGCETARAVRDELWDTADAIAARPGCAYGAEGDPVWDRQMERVRAEQDMADELHVLSVEVR